MSRNIFITGGAGFIGSRFAKYWNTKYPQDLVYVYDALTYAGTLENLHDVDAEFVFGNITDRPFLINLFGQLHPDIVINFAAESHNSRGVHNPISFYETNVVGTASLMSACLEKEIPRVHHISTCEVYGDLSLEDSYAFVEDDPYRPNTPYSSSKAGADLAVLAFHKTFGLPVTISNCCNNYGIHQHPEKLIPKFITSCILGEPLTVYKHAQNRREWIHVDDHCSAIDLILHHGNIGETYNVGTWQELSILDIAHNILNHFFGVEEDFDNHIQYIEDRPGHDRRYLLNSSKIMWELHWSPEHEVLKEFGNLIRWYTENEWWWKPLLHGLIDEKGWRSNGG